MTGQYQDLQRLISFCDILILNESKNCPKVGAFESKTSTEKRSNSLANFSLHPDIRKNVRLSVVRTLKSSLHYDQFWKEASF